MQIENKNDVAVKVLVALIDNFEGAVKQITSADDGDEFTAFALGRRDAFAEAIRACKTLLNIARSETQSETQ